MYVHRTALVLGFVFVFVSACAFVIVYAFRIGIGITYVVLCTCIHSDVYIVFVVRIWNCVRVVFAFVIAVYSYLCCSVFAFVVAIVYICNVFAPTLYLQLYLCCVCVLLYVYSHSCSFS